ncbi:MAG: exonuclease domain-containing protein [Porticoccaceae bacterium]
MQKEIWVVDIEASGLSPASYPIEVGVFNGRQEYQSLISPAEPWTHWSLKAEELHGISREELDKTGTSSPVVAGSLNRLLGASTVFSDHGDWDDFWLKRLFENAGIKQTFAVEDISTLLSDGQAGVFDAYLGKLRKTKEYRAHRALDDARIIYRAIIYALSTGTQYPVEKARRV